MCRRLGIYGGYGQPLHGGLAPFVRVSRRSAYSIPDGLDVADAALAEPMAVAVHAVRRAPSLLGSTVLVLGAGPIGLGVTMAVRAAGARIVIASEISTARRRAATRSGATVVVDPSADGRFDAPTLVSDHIPLGRLVDDGLEELLHHADRHVKILVDPNA